MKTPALVGAAGMNQRSHNGATNNAAIEVIYPPAPTRTVDRIPLRPAARSAGISVQRSGRPWPSFHPQSGGRRLPANLRRCYSAVMPHTDTDIPHTAVALILEHGDTAPIHAAMEADACLEAGDMDGAAKKRLVLRAVGVFSATVWQRISKKTIGSICCFVSTIGI